MRANLPRQVLTAPRSRLTFLSIGTVLAVGLLPIAGCVGDNEATGPQDPDQVLAALMDDGKLPDTMKGGGAVPPPPRFCFGDQGSGGMFVPGGTGGISGGMPKSAVDGGSTGPGMGSGGSGGGSFDMRPMAADASVDGFGTGGKMGMDPGGSGGSGGTDPTCASQPIAVWNFDDCNTDRTELFDSTFERHNAFRAVDVACVPDQRNGLATAFTSSEDVVYAPDQPDFVLSEGVTIAAWIKPDRFGGVRTLFRKRDDGSSAFALVLNERNLQFVVRLTNGTLASVAVPAGKLGQWAHVAASYDGKFMRLYTNGKEASKLRVTGKLTRGAGPLLMGNDIAGRRFQGTLDAVWFNTLAAPAATIAELACFRNAPTLAVTPAVGPSVQPGTPVTYQLAVTSHDGAVCPAGGFSTQVGAPPEFTIDAGMNGGFVNVAPGKTVTVPIVVSSGSETEAGTYSLFFGVNGDGGFAQAEAQFVVAEQTGCHVSSARELTIRDVSVVDDPVRTTMDGDTSDPRTGAWSFGRLMERLSPTAADAPDVTEAMFGTFLNARTINGFTVQARGGMEPLVLAPWPRGADGKLSLAQAPMRLLAIVNRLDLKDLPKGKAGEGRLVYGVLGPGGNQMQFTVIFEYLLPATTELEFKAWADQFHALRALPFPSEAYNTALQAITDSFTARDAMPGKPNGSSLIDIRTNEIALGGQWELREFRLSAANGFLDPFPVFNTPDRLFNRSPVLAQFINQNTAAILAETHEIPATFNGAPFQAGAIFNNLFEFWFGVGVANPEARHKFALNTCNGCHGSETNTGFLHIFPREVGQPSGLSGFMTGITVFDRMNGTVRNFNELGRRRQLLEALVCAPGNP